MEKKKKTKNETLNRQATKENQNSLFTAESVTKFGRSVQSKRSYSSHGFEFAKDIRTLVVTTFKEHSMQRNSH